MIISVQNSFSPSHIINAAVKAGTRAAAQAGELKKDKRHDSNVSSYGCFFYPLVVESYGVWSEHSLELLKSIAKGLLCLPVKVSAELLLTTTCETVAI